MIQEKLREQLRQLAIQLQLLGIKKKHVCIVGSFVLAINNIRQSRDVDLVILPKIRKRLTDKKKATKITENIEVVGKEWASSIGLSDESVINDSRFYNLTYGYKVIKPEVVFLVSLFRRREKDIRDVELLEQYALKTKHWDWDLIRNIIPISRDGDIKYRTKSERKNKLDTKLVVNISPSLRSQLITKLPTAALLGDQFLKSEFCGYDILLQYLTIKSIMNKNERLRSYCIQLQHEIVGQEYTDFSKLIESFREKGFLSRHPIPITRDGLILDRASRMACALYFDIPEIPVVIQQKNKKIYYNRKWFIEHGSDEKFLMKLDNIKDDIFRKYGLWLWVTLWPPVSPWFNEISKKLSKFTVKWEQSLHLGKSLPDFVRQVYSVDDIEKWKVELKINAMREFEPKVHLLALDIPSDHFKLKKDAHAYQSKTAVSLKKWIRKSYRDKISNYFYDKIVHIGDNHEHNRKIFELLKEHNCFTNENT